MTAIISNLPDENAKVESTNISETSAESQKTDVIAQTGKTIGRFNNVLIWGMALLGVAATPPSALAQNQSHSVSPYEQLADASGKSILVINEKVVKPELFKILETISKKDFEKLSPFYQQKVLSYFQTGKWSPDQENFTEGVVSLIDLYSNIEKAQRALAEYSKTGQIPTETPLGLKGFVRTINSGFPDAKTYIDIETIQKIDTLVKNMYETIIAKSEKEIEKSKKHIEKLKKDEAILDTLLKSL